VVYGCGEDEAVLFREVGPRLGVAVAVSAAAVSTDTVDLVRGARCISVGHKTPVSNRTLSLLSRAGVAYISTRSTGLNHIDVDFAHSVGITVEPVAYSPDSVADYALMLMLMALRHAKSVFGRASAHDYRLEHVRGRELRDLTVGVVGTGRIGSAVIERLRGFGCRILAHDIRSEASAHHVDLDHLVDESDVITLHTPLNASTHHLLDRRRIERMKPGAYVVNTGRGALLDTEALVAALESNALGGAALDVLEGEDGIFYADSSDGHLPNPHLLRLQRLPNVLISPHTAFYTDHALVDTVESSIVNCLRFEGVTARG
jgi:D-specific alpha-keto acid dehydrogenase